MPVSERRGQCVVLQHLPAEGPYAIAEALTGAGVPTDICRLYEGRAVPASVDTVAGLVVMGGSMAAYSDEGFPTRRAELDLLAAALDAGTPVLGVCLGAQLLVHAAGGRVFPGTAGPEIGWAPVRLLEAAADDALFGGLDGPLQVLHWHGDTFEPPSGAVLLASSDRYVNQAVRIGEAAWGLQFHLEVDERAVDAFLEDFGGDALGAGTDGGEIASTAPGALAGLQAARSTVLDRFAVAVRVRSEALVS